MSLSDVLHERVVNVKNLVELVGALHPIVQGEERRRSISIGKLLKFTKMDFVLVAREDFHTNEKLFRR